MPTSLYLLSTNKNATGLFDFFLGGFYLIKGIPLVLQLLILVAFPLSASFALLSNRLGDKKIPKAYSIASISFSLLGFVSCCLLLFQPWDEVFINLQHSSLLSTQNSFSFNPRFPIEGTVDFLIYLLLGLLAKLGLPLPELAFFQSLTGGILCLLAASKIAQKLNPEIKPAYSILFFSLFAPLLLNSSHGFVTTCFTASILWSIYFIYFTPRRKIGFLILSIIPLIRIEGVWFLLLCWLQTAITSGWNKNLPKKLLELLIIQIPFLALSGFRYFYFGSIVPLPILFKSSIGNPFYTIIGIRNLIADLVAGHGFLSLLTLGICYSQNRGQKFKMLIGPLTPIILLVLPYYLSGGDWFPSSWGRYLFPLTLYSTIAAFTSVSLLNPESRRLALTLVSFGFILQNLTSFGAFPKAIELVFSPRKSLAPLDIRKKIHRVNYRSHHLSQLGIHLKELTLPTDIIASSEIATIMYFAERETLDFLGLTNKEIISKPLRPTPDLWRSNPKTNELPFLIFKRLAPELLGIKQPNILYTFDFLTEEILEDIPFDELSAENLLFALKRWEKKFKGLLDPLYGGLSSILEAGYTPILVKYQNEFCSLYFVSKASLKLHLETAGRSGFTVDKLDFVAFRDRI